MDKLEMMMQWLESFFLWGDTQWGVDLNGRVPASCQLTLEDDRVIRRTEDVLGNVVLTMQIQFALVRVSYYEEAPGLWADELANWMLIQSKEGCGPEIGDSPSQFRLEKGKLELKGDQAVYTVKLIGNYERII